jgi:hypothetical protein
VTPPNPQISLIISVALQLQAIQRRQVAVGGVGLKS